MNSSEIVLLLVSNAFIGSDYCMNKEYKAAMARRSRGEAEVISVIVRPCDWDSDNLRSLLALPTDGRAVTTDAPQRAEPTTRDAAWLNVVTGLKGVISDIQDRITPPALADDYVNRLFFTSALRHPELHEFDERLFFVDPDIFYENEKEQITSFDRFMERVKEKKVSIVTGYDLSGKSFLAKMLQFRLLEIGMPAVIINGDDIQNSDIDRLVQSEIGRQFCSSRFTLSKYTIIIDDFEDCRLNDRTKEIIIRRLHDNYDRNVLFSFSSAPSAIFAPDDLPSPAVFNLSQLNVGKLYKLVKLWKTVGNSYVVEDKVVVDIFQKLQIVFNQTEMEISPYSALIFLNLLETSAGSDIAYSSFAACYETLIILRLKDADVETGSLDECKNFLAFVAYRAFVETSSGHLSRSAFDECLRSYEENFLSNRAKLKSAVIGPFLTTRNGDYYFNEEYMWYFLCARYVAKVLSVDNNSEFRDFVAYSTANIYLKKFANIVIFLGYHSTDNLIIESLMNTVDRLFSKTNDWRLSDESRELMLGIAPKLVSYTPDYEKVEDHRVTLTKAKVDDLLNSAEDVVAKYTLPFLHTRIEDTSDVSDINPAIQEFDHDAYMQSVNALFRAHSVIGHILGTRAGTYPASIILDCVNRMVQASGRYASLNHAIATILTYDRDRSIQGIRDALSIDEKAAEERYNKVKRIFSFWSVYMSQAGLARYLCQEHTIRALGLLVEKYEKEVPGEKTPFNFTSVKIIAELYRSGKIDRDSIDDVLQKYGDQSAIVALLKVTFHIYAYYMPLTSKDKQWISTKMNIPLKKIEAQRLKSTTIRIMNKGGESTV